MPHRDRVVSVGQSSGSSDGATGDVVVMGGALPGNSNQIAYQSEETDPYRLDGISAGTRPTTGYTDASGVVGSYFDPTPETVYRQDLPTDERREAFLVEQPAEGGSPSLARRKSEGSFYGEWMAPASSVVASGATGVVAGVYRPTGLGDDDGEKTPTDERKPEVPRKSEERNGRDIEQNVAAYDANKSASGSMSSAQESETDQQIGAKAPGITRKDTDISISQLHLPGKFPKQT